MAEDEDVTIDFVSLGMFILDDIEFKPPRPPVKDVVGGAGAYSAIGARIMSPPPLSRSVGWIVDCGSDFPPEVRETISHWDTSCLFRETPSRLTTRGWNGYGENEHRAFRYTTEKLRIDHDALTPELLLSKSYHLICSSTRCIDLVTNILFKRKCLAPDRWVNPPLFIWEPVPDLCVPDDMEKCQQALRYVDVVSPNHGELGGYFARSTTTPEGDVDKKAVEECTESWLASGVGAKGNGAVVVRCGKDGCYVASRERKVWVPAYHTSSDAVVDPTGGGNGFLGGLAVGLVRGGATPGVQNVEEAAIWGSIAASFAIEQVGMPILEKGVNGEGEKWNEVRVEDRLREYRDRLEELETN
ncbi:Carbohydrate/purine kinase [Neofusicoccum parvum]|uniref:Carbohydrate/purine kinase n=1 Tax=Neofusicoccum parvum TaxID=310453 RepID=A0ACB5RTK5_9PEZI|nr:Carbohydrate/purine kinase [Neofusicoccum parvum]GME42342.1 Carbohydrate/purine kinase [Neofusicoccum parvum]